MLESFTQVSTAPSGHARLRVYTTPGPANTVPAILLHAGICDSRMWHHELKTLGGQRRMIAFDRRGFGESPAVGEPFDSIDDVFAVLDSLAVERAVIVGCSMGGRFALDCLTARPERVAGLVLVAGAIGGAPDLPEAHDPRMKPLEQRYEALEAGSDLEAVVRFEAHYWLDGPLAPEGRVGGPVRELLLDMDRKSRSAPETGPTVLAESGWATLPKVAVPTLVVWGTLDEPVVVAFMRHAAATIPGAQALEIDGVAHFPNLERPELFTSVLATFLDRVH